MKTIISFGDFSDLYFKLHHTGFKKVLSRLTQISNKNRVEKAWSTVESKAQSNWWIIPSVQRRWNKLITGKPDLDYPNYIIKKYFSDRPNLRLLSPGCGTGNKEVKFAVFDNFNLIEAFDVSPERIKTAKKTAERMGLKNIEYRVSDVYSFKYVKNYYDVILFDSFLHHIKNLDSVLNKVSESLKKDGILIINEYVGPNRFQWSKIQLQFANDALNKLPDKFKTRFSTSKIKTKIYRPGLIRMVLSDPSEAVNSENILPKLRERFNILEERPYGGNILHLTLKDISHNFVNENEESIHLLGKLFKTEDHFLNSGNDSDFVFGIYSKN